MIINSDIKKIVNRVEWIFDIVVVIAVSLIYYLNIPISSQKVVYIPQGSINKIITYLHSESRNVTQLDSYILRLVGLPQHGWINVGEHTLRKYDYLHRLTHSKAALKDITLIPGETTYFFFLYLHQELELSVEKLQYFYKMYRYTLEGNFVADTYKIPLGISEEALVRLLLKRSDEKYHEWSKRIFGTYERKKWFQYVTIASIIQKEAADSADMLNVSSVIHNRLKKGMKLQMDGTLNYGKFSHTRVTSKMIRNNKSSYNTYKNKGIPRYPVCNVSFDAIKAAIFPAKTEYLYFVKTSNGKHKYARYFSTHKKNINNATR